MIFVALLLLNLTCLPPGIFAIAYAYRSIRHRGKIQCANCTYDLTGLPSEQHACPECGSSSQRISRRVSERTRKTVLRIGVILVAVPVSADVALVVLLLSLIFTL